MRRGVRASTAVFQATIDAVPDALRVDRDRAGSSVLIPLTESSDGLVEVAVQVRLWRAHWRGVRVHEFKYAIVRVDHVTGEADEIFDRNQAAGLIAPVRALVLPCVRAAAQALVAAVSPAYVYRATYLTRPPDKSLAKHQMMTDAFIDLGYDVLVDDVDSSARRFWLMERRGGGED